MNEEEAIKILIELSTYDYVKLENGDEAIETVLNMLKEKDKIIALMAEKMAFDYDINSIVDVYTYKRQIKQYFKSKAEKE